MALAVSIQDMCKSYGTLRAVDGLDLSVAEGEIFGILGPNGSGKTTTVECAYGLRKADAGRVRIFDLDPYADPDHVGRLVGAQLQDSALPDRLRVAEAVHLFGALAGHHGRSGHARGPVDEEGVLDRWGLSAKRRASYGSLSGGQRQRLHIALALVTRPRLVFLDEMTTGLDPNARREVWDLVEQVRREGTTVVLVTHFMDEAQRLCDRLAVFIAGRVVAQGTPGELIAAHGGGSSVHFVLPDHGPPLPRLEKVPGVLDVRCDEGRVDVHGSGPFLVGLGHALTTGGLGEVQMTVDQPSLEDAYVHLVGPGDGDDPR
ncbi:MAG TPA: ABC transporter ATP-binding protein [Micromonosporaceae bacterium]|jgi:ABC-2 type transport system ATP-binding protein